MAEDTPATTDGAEDGVAKAPAVAAGGMQTLRARTVARGTIWQETLNPRLSASLNGCGPRRP